MRYGLHGLYLEAFLGSGGSATSGIAPAASRLGSALRICLQGTPTRLHRNPVTGLPTVLRPSIARSYKYGTVNPFPISYAFQPCLRGRLTLGRLPLPRKPWIYGECVSRTFYRYSCQHNHIVTHVSIITSLKSSTPFDAPSTRRERSPTNSQRLVRGFGSMLSPVTFSAQRH